MRLPFQLNGFPPRVGLGGTTMPNGLGKGSGGERKTHMKKEGSCRFFTEENKIWVFAQCFVFPKLPFY